MHSDTDHRIYRMGWVVIHAAYVTKIERKGRSKADLDHLLCWISGRDPAGLAAVLQNGTTLREFFENAPAMNPARLAVTGVICGVRIEQIEHPLMKEIRILDKLVDELAKGRPMQKILRA